MVSDSISHFREAILSENRRTIAHSIAAPTGVWRTLLLHCWVRWLTAGRRARISFFSICLFSTLRTLIPIPVIGDSYPSYWSEISMASGAVNTTSQAQSKRSPIDSSDSDGFGKCITLWLTLKTSSSYYIWWIHDKKSLHRCFNSDKRFKRFSFYQNLEVPCITITNSLYYKRNIYRYIYIYINYTYTVVCPSYRREGQSWSQII